MAGLKKSKRQKDASSPNLVLVLFLIFFILGTILLGAWLYFTYQDRDRALAEKTAATRTANADRKAMEVYQIVLDDLRLALGQQLTEDEKKAQDIKRKAFIEGGQYAGVEEKNRPAYLKLLADLRNDLGFDEATGEFKTTYPAKVKAAAEEATANQASFKAVQKKMQDAEAMFKQLSEKQDTYFADATNRFDKEQKAVLSAANKQTGEMTALIDVNRKLNDQIVQDEQKAKKAETALRKQITELKAQLKAKEEERPEAQVARADNREPHALMLDVSLGKPLWDEPVGTITRVDAKAKEVTINVGSARGVKPDLTFTVFAPSKFVATRAEKQMKGTIEVTRVLGPNAAQARITAQFDPDFPIHEGDLLFNLFWGTRVAIAGYVGVTGVPSDSPSEQMRQLNDFMYLCERQGIIVDAYLDLTDGQVKGAITPNTRYLIRGEDLRLDPKELENKEPRAERALNVNNAIAQMRKDAIEKGLFIISAKNFATVIGYRPASASRDQTAFRPALPAAGSPIPSVGGAGPREQPMPPAVAPPEKKDGGEKEKM